MGEERKKLAPVAEYIPLRQGRVKETQIIDLSYNAKKIKDKQVDNSDIGDGKFLTYDASSGKLVYKTAPTGGNTVRKDIVGEKISVGDVLYMKSDSKWWKADANQVTTMPGAALAMQTVKANKKCEMLMIGFFENPSWSYAVGSLLYVSTTPGPPTQAMPAGTGEQVQVIGYVLTPTMICFSPGYELVEAS